MKKITVKSKDGQVKSTVGVTAPKLIKHFADSGDRRSKNAHHVLENRKRRAARTRARNAEAKVKTPVSHAEAITVPVTSPAWAKWVRANDVIPYPVEQRTKSY